MGKVLIASGMTTGTTFVFCGTTGTYDDYQLATDDLMVKK